MHDYLTTRVSLFRSRLWSEDQLGRLAVAPDADMARLLAAHGLAGLAAGYAGDNPRSLEARIVAIVLAEARILLRPLVGAARQLLLYWLGRFEVSNVKSLVRAKLAGEGAQATAARLLDLADFSRLDVDQLMRAEDVSELMRRLEPSPYAEIVRNARQAFEESRDIFILDATLDRAYYDGLIRRARVLEAEAGRAFACLMADLIDRVNLVWLLRYRFNYGLPPAQVYYLLPGPGYRLHDRLLRDLVGREAVASVLAGLPGPLAALLAGANGIPEIAARLERQTTRLAEGVLAAPDQPLARVMAYLTLRETGLRDVRAILRGRRLGLSVDDIRLAAGLAAA